MHIRATTNKKMGARAFTLVETLVAISILIIALTGPLAIIAQSLKSSYFSRDEITAAYLAQEPIEYIRNVRDQNSLQSPNASTWLRGITPGARTDLTVDASNNNLINNPGSNQIKVKLVWQGGQYALQKCIIDCRVTYDPTAGVIGNGNKVIYGSTGGGVIDSIYTRDIYMSNADYAAQNNDPQRELVITVVVSWSTGGITHNVTVTEHLFNWQLESA